MKIIIIGGKGTAIDIAEQIVNANVDFGCQDEFIGWAIDDESLGDSINGYPVLCKTRELSDKFLHSDVKILFSLYKPEKMKERAELLRSYGLDRKRFVNFIHPSAYVARSVDLGVGNAILSNSSIFSNVGIGSFNIIYGSIGHDTKIGDSNFIARSSLLCSNVLVSNGAFLGLNSTVRGDLEIGNYAFIGMGSNVTRNVDANQLVYGNPAKPR